MRIPIRTRIASPTRTRIRIPIPTRTRSVLGFGASLLAACTSIGPRSIERDRFDYSSAVAESWKQQTLLNIVKLRYLDMPVFVDVSQIVGGYTLESTLQAAGTIIPGPGTTNSATIGATAKYTDRPTITYAPLTGAKFLRGMLMPIPPESVFYVISAGYAADFVLAIAVDALNGLQNPIGRPSEGAGSDDRFMEVVSLLRAIQLSGAVGIRVEKGSDGVPAGVMFFRRENISEDMRGKIARVQGLLDLTPGQAKYRLVYAPVRLSQEEFAVKTRSLIQILTAMAGGVEIPEEDVREGRALPSWRSPSVAETRPMFRVRSGASAPDHPFICVSYRDRWYWVDDDDLVTKRAVLFVMMLFTLADTGEEGQLPLLTIPTG